MVDSPGAQLRPVETVVADDGLRHGQHRVVHRHVEKLAHPRLPGVGDGGTPSPRAISVPGKMSPTLAPAGMPPRLFGTGDVHVPAHALRDDVVRRAVNIRTCAGAPVAEAPDAGVDELRIARANGLVPDAQPVHHAVAHVLDERVGALAQRQQHVPVRSVLQVQHDAALVAVDAREIPAEVHPRRARPRQAAPSPAPGAAPGGWRRPRGGSTLITSAPRSASSAVP